MPCKGVGTAKTIRIDLPREYTSLTIIPISDIHTGDPLADLAAVRRIIKYIAETPTAYTLLNGDLANVATALGKSDPYNATSNTTGQYMGLVDLFAPVRDKVLGITCGNHEARVYRETGLDMMAVLSEQLGLYDRYSPEGLYIFLRFGEGPKWETRGGAKRQLLYTIYAQHGSRGGRTAGSKVNALMSLQQIVEADIYIHSHTHMGAIIPGTALRPDVQNSGVQEHPVLFVNSSGHLEYGGYGETKGFPPLGRVTPWIYLNGTRKEMDADLGQRQFW